MSSHSEQLEEVEALQAIYHDEVEVLCDDEGVSAVCFLPVWGGRYLWN